MQTKVDGENLMKEKEELLNEIMEQVRRLAPENQKRILDVVKAMVYTREVVEGEREDRLFAKEECL